MEKSFKEQLLDIKKRQDIAYVYFHNNGEISTEKNLFAKELDTFNNDSSIERIKNTISNATEYYSYHCDFDTIDMNLILGLIFRKEDVDENNHVKFGKLPINGIVHYYINEVNTLLDDEKTNRVGYISNTHGAQGYLNYNEFIKALENDDIIFNGPKSFNEFLEAMSNIPFNLNLVVHLLEKENNKKLVLK